MDSRTILPEASLTVTIAAGLVADLFERAEAARWDLSAEEFAEALHGSAANAFAGRVPSQREVDRFLSGLRLADLALARACALGREAAWDHFVREHRPVLYRAADALDPTGGAREIADGLYAELYGLADSAPERRSLLRYFHGRSSLATWLRAVLAQRQVDSLRSRRRIEPLAEEVTPLPPDGRPPADPDRPRLVGLVFDALRLAVDALAAKDRLRLRSYYAAELTLAQIGRITAEHEATVSRHLTRTRRQVRDGIERHLREQAGLSGAEIARALELALEDPGGLDLQQVFDRGVDRKESSDERSR